MSTCISVGVGIIVNVADLRLVSIRNVSDKDFRIELHFKFIRNLFSLYFFANKNERDRVFKQIQQMMLDQS